MKSILINKPWLFFVFFLNMYSGLFGQIDFPLSPYNLQNRCAGTVGEYRVTGRLHRGLDFSYSQYGPNTGVAVVSLETGEVTKVVGTTICVENYCYNHLSDFQVAEGDQVSNGDT